MKKNSLVMLVLSCILVGCAPTKRLASSSEFYTSEPQISSYIVPAIANLEVSKDLLKYTEQLSLLTELNEEEKIAFAEAEKNNVLNRALLQANAYIMMAPMFNIEYNATSITITVQGFPATIKSWRDATPADEWILKMSSNPVQATYNQQNEKTGFFKK